MAAWRALLAVAAALAVVVTVPVDVNAEEISPSEEWSYRASEEWSPASSAEWPASSIAGGLTAESCFGAPPLAESNVDGTELPRYYAVPPCDAWQVHSHFQPMLGRFGFIAPRAPGTESVHSAYLADRPHERCAQSCEQPSQLFSPPPVAHQTAPSAGDSPGAKHHGPVVDSRAELAPYCEGDFTGDPYFDHIPWDSYAEQNVYGGKHLNPVQRPLVEWGMPLYLNGPVPPPTFEFGATNPSVKRFYVYGDYRAAAAYNAQNGGDRGVLANRINLELDYWMTATERFHGSIGPFQDGNDFVGVAFDDSRGDFIDAFDVFDADTDTLFFEGDVGAMLGGATGRYAPFDMPVAVGLIPLLFQNGVWMEDAIVGAAVTIPARNSPLLDWSNYDATFFCGFDQVNSPAFDQFTSSNVFGATTMIEAKGGYIEAGYAFLDDQTQAGRSYNNVGVSYTRRYLNLVSNSMRVIANAGQDGPESDRTAEGLLLIAENSFLTPWPYNVIPYTNAWVGFDDPQSVARAGAAGGVLRNTGILFESDNLTGYPTLDASGNDTCGAAIGLDLLAPDFSHQLILEAALLQAFGDPTTRSAPGDQYGIGARYQIPISYATLLRFDAMHGWFENSDDVTGARAEFRWKF